MISSIINRQKNQLTLDFESGLVSRYRSLRDCIATGVYRRGVTNTAAELDLAPSNLSVQISDDPARNFSIDSFERYIEKTNDMTPVYYLVEKFLSDKTVKQDAALEAVADMVSQVLPALRAAGFIKE